MTDYIPPTHDELLEMVGLDQKVPGQKEKVTEWLLHGGPIRFGHVTVRAEGGDREWREVEECEHCQGGSIKYIKGCPFCTDGWVVKRDMR